MRVIVVGGGIMGLCTAWGVYRQGHRPVVYERGPIPNPLGSSVDRSRLIRFAYGSMAGYARMVFDAYEAWEALWRDLGRRHYVETGMLGITRGAEDWARESAAVLTELKVPWEELGEAEIAARYPFIVSEGAGWALFSPTGGVLAADAIVADLAAHLRSKGVEVHDHTPVREVDPGRAAVRLERGGEDAGDALVVAAGPWAPRLVAGALRGRVVPSRQVAVYVEPPVAQREAWRRAPMVLDAIGTEDAQGGFYAVPLVKGDALKVGDHGFHATPVEHRPGGEAIKISDHGFSRHGDPDRDREPTPEDVRAVMDICRNRLREFESYRVTEARTCFYSVTADERFIAEPVERAWVLVGFSGHGFKFGASMGLATAEAVAGARDADALRTYAAGLDVRA